MKLVGVSQDQARASCIAKGYAGLGGGPLTPALAAGLKLLGYAEPNFGPVNFNYFLDGKNGTECNALRYNETDKSAAAALVSCTGGSNIGYVCISNATATSKFELI